MEFLLTIDKRIRVFEVARIIKMKDKLLNGNILEKLEIEREYWKRCLGFIYYLFLNSIFPPPIWKY